MNDIIYFIQLSAKLPGYLFILANLTNPSDTIHLNCTEEKRTFISSMLPQIGLSVQPCMQYQEGQTQKQIILSVCEELQDIREIKTCDAIKILLLPYQTPIQQFEHCAINILSRYPNYIIIDELQDLADSKTFSVALSKESYYYAQLKQRIVRSRLN